MSLEYLRREGGTDIGHGVKIFATGTVWAAEPGAQADQVVGIIEEHDGKDGQRCSGYVKFRGREPNPDGRPAWVVESEEPLTLSPSVLCTTCGHHGFIRDGKWVPA